MSLPFVFNSLSDNVPASDLDTNFNAVAAMAITQCTATGTNSITLTPNANQPPVGSYENYQQYSFVAVNDSTSFVQVQLGSLGLIPLYLSDSSTQASNGDVKATRFYVIAYNSALNSGAGGVVLVSATPSTGASGVTSVTFTGDGVVLSNTPSDPVTGAGTVTASLNTHAKNLVFAGPTTGADATPTFRALVTADLPVSAISSMVLLSTQTAAVSATLDFIGVMSSTYDSYLFVIDNLLISAADSLLMLFSTNNGGTFLNSNSFYQWQVSNVAVTTQTNSADSSAATRSFMKVTNNVAAAATIFGSLNLIGANNTGNNDTFYHFEGMTLESGVRIRQNSAGGKLATSFPAGAINAVRFLPDGGGDKFTSGVIKMYGLIA